MTTYRTGRHNHRTIYVQQGDEPARTDPQVGTMDTPELGRLVVELLNELERSTVGEDTARTLPCADCRGCPVCHGPIEYDAVITHIDATGAAHHVQGPWQCAKGCDPRTASEAR